MATTTIGNSEQLDKMKIYEAELQLSIDLYGWGSECERIEKFHSIKTRGFLFTFADHVYGDL